MTRILYWNINNFSRPKIDDLRSAATQLESEQRLQLILERVLAPNPPDIFVIAEVHARIREVGRQGLVLGEARPAGFACLMLLERIRATLGANWCLVPPLNLGSEGFREAVAVYYNAAAVHFTGPFVYAQPNPLVALSYGQPPAWVPSFQVRDYSRAWRRCLPGGENAIPQQNWGPVVFSDGRALEVSERHGAGRWEHYTVAGNRIDFGGPLCRAPFYTRFWDGARTIKLWSIHTSPGTAREAVEALTDIPDLRATRENEVSVVIGDFNVDSFSAPRNRCYRGLLAAGYQMLLNPWEGAALVPNRKAYCMTHLLPLDLAGPFNNVGVATDPQHNVYPRFGYMGGIRIHPRAASNSGAIDNAFVCYGEGAAEFPHETSIVNTVVGKPYNALAPAPAGVGADLTGGLAYPSSMAEAIPLPAGVAPGVPTNFLEWENYEKIHSTSDHLALLVRV